jgi:hypothetical protein
MSKFKPSAAFKAAIQASLIAHAGGNASAADIEHFCSALVRCAPPVLLRRWAREGRSADYCGAQLAQLLGDALQSEASSPSRAVH